MMMSGDYLLVVDLEANFDNHGEIPEVEMETIEIGAVTVGIGDWRPVSEFQTFVRPVRHPVLSDECMALTHICQADVDSAPDFPRALNEFGIWLGQYSCSLWCSWGRFDSKQITRECAYHGVNSPLPASYEDLKRRAHKKHKALFGKKSPSLLTALAAFGLEPEGKAHRALDDARNVARLLPHILS